MCVIPWPKFAKTTHQVVDKNFYRNQHNVFNPRYFSKPFIGRSWALNCKFLLSIICFLDTPMIMTLQWLYLIMKKSQKKFLTLNYRAWVLRVFISLFSSIFFAHFFINSNKNMCLMFSLPRSFLLKHLLTRKKGDEEKFSVFSSSFFDQFCY